MVDMVMNDIMPDRRRLVAASLIKKFRLAKDIRKSSGFVYS